MSKLSSIATCYLQIEEDTDRDRYMSPLEAKNYGLIDEVIGGDEAGFQISGTTRDFPKTKESYVNWVRPGILSFMLIIGQPDLHKRIVCLEHNLVLPEQ